MEQEKIKIAFVKAKQDIDSLKSELYYLNEDIQEIKRTLHQLLDQQTNQQTLQPTNQQINPAQIDQNPSIQHIPTDEHAHYALKQRFMSTSIGNDGVPTNQPTNQQTNQHPLISTADLTQNKPETHQKQQKITNSDKISHLEQVSQVLSSLDDIKKELRIKFKHLTSQEMLVFSSIYQLEEQGFIVDYSLLSQKLALSEISIRDYIRKLIKKGIPINKSKEDNKKVQLFISPNLKKIASLSTILSLKAL